MYTAANSYRYGFNGKENDNEVKSEGNQQDYGMRIYDPRLGKFLSVDPLRESYPFYTPYQFAGNMPIVAIDLDGLEPKIASTPEQSIMLPPITITAKAPSEGASRKVQTGSIQIGAPTSFATYGVIPEMDTKIHEIPIYKEEKFHKGSTYFDRGWYNLSEYRVTQLDWDHGQVTFPLGDLDYITETLGFTDPITPINGNLGGRDWNGFQVDEKGYLTGNLYSGPSMVYMANPIRAVRNVARVFKSLRRFRGIDELPIQVHHFATNKSSIWTAQMSAVAKKFGLSLNGSWNKASMPHLGRHPNEYHEFVFKNMVQAAMKASGNTEKFLELFNELVKQPLLKNPNLLRKSGWTK